MRQNQYNMLSGLQTSLRSLFKTVEYAPAEIKIKLPNKIIQKIQAFLDKSVIYNYLDAVVGQINEATKILNNTKQEMLKISENNDLNMCRIKELEEKLQAQKNQNSTQTIPYVAYQNDKAFVQCGENEEAIIKQLISFYDKQIIKRDFAAGGDNEQSKEALCIIDSTIKELLQTLKKIGVTVINTPGAPVGTDDDVVDIIETEDSGLDGKIASVVRVGYSYKQNLQRAQEVVAYKKRGN